MSLHTKVETQQEVGEIQANAQAIAQSYLLVELIELEHTAGLVLVFFYCPYIAGIDECAQLNHPKQFGTILQIHVEAHIAALINEAVHRAGAKAPRRKRDG